MLDPPILSCTSSPLVALQGPPCDMNTLGFREGTRLAHCCCLCQGVPGGAQRFLSPSTSLLSPSTYCVARLWARRAISGTGFWFTLCLRAANTGVTDSLSCHCLSRKLPPSYCQTHPQIMLLDRAPVLPCCLPPVPWNQAGHAQRSLTFCSAHQASPKSTQGPPRTAASVPLVALGQSWIRWVGQCPPRLLCWADCGVSPFLLIMALIFIK